MLAAKHILTRPKDRQEHWPCAAQKPWPHSGLEQDALQDPESQSPSLFKTKELIAVRNTSHMQ